ncbi:MAG: hypothetical protein WD359_02930 [Dehalococcoidia bacterium]
MTKKRKRRDRRSDAAPPGTTPAAEPSMAAEPDWRLPSPLARVAGAALAVLTLVIAAFTIISAVSDDLAAVDAVVRLAVGAFLIALAIVIGALSLVPAYTRRFIVRG